MKTNRIKYVSAVWVMLCFVAFAVTFSNSAYAQDKLTVTSFGGSFQAAQSKAYMKPFAKEFGVTVLEDEWHGDMAKLRAMVQAGNVTWDVLDLSDGQIELACEEGLLEPLDAAMLGPADNFIPGAISECGVLNLVAAIVVGYDSKRFPNNEPQTLMDFWDVKKFPGPRSMKKWPKHNMEFALLADGVPPDKIYEVLSTEAGIARAFRKLDEIKPHIKVWFNNWAQPGQLMADGEVAFSIGTNGRLAVAAKSHAAVKFFWDRAGLGSDVWAIVKGSKNKELAQKFIQFANKPENQAVFSEAILYGPTVKEALAKMPPELAAQMPTASQNMKTSWKIDSRFWSDNMDDFNIRFNAWLSK